jgi:hypothetical protein
MSIVAVHGPNTMGASGAGGAGTGEVITAPGGGGGVVTADANMANGMIFTFSWVGTTARPNADFDWAFPTGTPATAADTKGPTTVTYATAGAKTATLTVAAGAGPPAGGSYPITVQAKTGPRAVQEEEAGTFDADVGDSTEESVATAGEYDPGEHTVVEVEQYVAANPDELTDVYNAETAGKNRSTLVAHLEALFPYDPSEYGVADVVAYAQENPDEVADILDAERAGKNRSTLISQLEALQAG